MRASWPFSDLRFCLGAPLLISSLVPMPAHAQSGQSAQGSASAEVVEPIRAVSLADLSFGAISVARGGAGQVEVDPDGSTVRYLQAARPQCGGGGGCTPHPGSFAVFGAANQTYSVSLPFQIIARGRQTGRGLVVGDLETRSVNAAAQASGGRLDRHGRDTFFVGGTLSVPAGTPSDIFTAELPVTVSYN